VPSWDGSIPQRARQPRSLLSTWRRPSALRHGLEHGYARSAAGSFPIGLGVVPAIYHFTDIANLDGIVAARQLRAHRVAWCAVDIGDQSIKARRSTIGVPCGPGGHVGDYVPFYFATRSPMLFSIKSGNVPDVSSEQRRIVYLISSTEAAYAAGLSCVFTDGNAAAAFTTFTDDPTLLAEVVDWPLMRERYWSNTPEDPDRRRRRGAEFLVHDATPLAIINEIGVYDQQARATVAAALGDGPAVRVRRDWYF
jgi:hypothetical protein